MTKAAIFLLDLRAEYQPIRAEILGAIEQVLDNMTLYLGPNTCAVEQEFAAYVGVKHAVGVGSGTDALLLSYLALGLAAGDEVLVPSHTFIATVAPLAFLGAQPVFVDIDPLTFTLDPALLKPALTGRTRAVVPVHLYGQSADMDPVLEFAREHELRVVEDVCQAVGGDYRGRKLGSLGDVGCFSFVYTKNLKAYGDAGMITTNDAEMAARLRQLRDHGRADKYAHPAFGLNARLGEIEAAVVRVQMRYLEARTEGRRRNAAIYGRVLAPLAGRDLGLPVEQAWGRHVYHQYVVRSPERGGLAAHLAGRGIQTGVHYPIPCHLQGACAAYSHGPGSLPYTEAAAREVLSVPVYPELTEEQLHLIAGAIAEFVGGRGR